MAPRIVPRGHKPGDTYPLGDMPTVEETGMSSQRRWVDFRAEPTGEKRCPKKGEWYLSGAIVQAYRAPNDLGTEFMIAKLVRVKRTGTAPYRRV